MDAVNDLLDWEEEHDRLLPNNLEPEDIATLEADGWLVDLETGEVWRDPEVCDARAN